MRYSRRERRLYTGQLLEGEGEMGKDGTLAASSSPVSVCEDRNIFQEFILLQNS